MTENLKSCPFCGSNAEFNSDEFGEGVDCKSCGATLRNGVYGEYGRKLASAAWNTRPLEDAIQKELDEAREDNVDNMEYHVAERERLKAENARLREALEFYAELDGNGIQLYGDMDSKALEFDDGESFPFGKKARDALKGAENDT